MSKRPKNRRKKLIIDRSLQKRIIHDISLFPLLALCVAAISVAIFSIRVKDEAAESMVQLSSLGILNFSILAFVVVSGMLLVRQATIFSNRIAGPSYRICHSLKRVRDGDTDLRIQLRDGDFNTEIADEINLLLDWLAEKDQKQAAAAPAESSVTAKDAPAPVSH